jgi:hypothetical protein
MPNILEVSGNRRLSVIHTQGKKPESGLTFQSHKIPAIMISIHKVTGLTFPFPTPIIYTNHPKELCTGVCVTIAPQERPSGLLSILALRYR